MRSQAPGVIFCRPAIAIPARRQRRDGEKQAALGANDGTLGVQPHQARRLAPYVTSGTDALAALRVHLAAPSVGEPGAEPGAGDLPAQLGLQAIGRRAGTGGDRPLGGPKFRLQQSIEVALNGGLQSHYGRASSVQTSRSASRIGVPWTT